MYSTETVEFFEKKIEKHKTSLRRMQHGHVLISVKNLRKRISFYQQAVDALVKVGTMNVSSK